MNTSQKIFFLIICFSLFFFQGQTQSIKSQLQQKKQQEQYEQEEKKRQQEIELVQKENELKEQNRIQKAQLNIDNLIELLKNSDFGYIDKYLKNLGWLFENTDQEVSVNDKDTVDIFESVTWSFDKDIYSGLAAAWVTFYSSNNYSNILSYRIANEDAFTKMETSMTLKGFTKVENTKTVKSGLQTRYQYSDFEVVLTKFKKDNSDDGALVRYDFSIFNYKKVAQLILEKEKAERIAKEKEEKRIKEKQLAEQKAKEEELRIAEEKRQKEENYLKTITLGDNAFYSREYSLAKEYYENALIIFPEKEAEVYLKIQNVNNIEIFLVERKTKVYDFMEINEAEYKKIGNYIHSKLKEILESKENVDYQSFEIVYKIDTLRKITYNIPSSIKDKTFRKHLESIFISQPTKNGYNVMAKASYTFSFKKYHSIIEVKNKPNGIFSKHHDVGKYRTFINSKIDNKAPYGKYFFEFNKITLNGSVFENNKLIDAKGYGPEYVFLSMIIPGLGRHYVNLGEKNNPNTMSIIGVSTLYTGGLGLLLFPFVDKTGISTAIFTYGFAGASLYYYFSKQDIIGTDYFISHDDLAKGFGIIAGVYYIHELIYVLVKGAINMKNVNIWRYNQLGFLYDPISNGLGLTYSLNFK